MVTSQSDSDIQVRHHVGTLDQTPFFPLNMKIPQKPLDVVDLFIIGPIEKFVFFSGVQKPPPERIRMCCSYAETRPAQQEAYKQLKAHLDKVRLARVFSRADDGIPKCGNPEVITSVRWGTLW